MRRLLLVVVLVLGGCGAAGTSTAPGQSTATEAQKTVSGDCAKTLGAFVTALEDLNSRLSVGMAFSAYGDKVGAVKAAYDQIDWKSVDVDCAQPAGVPAENALNDYVQAYTAWNDCVGSTSCTNDSVKPKLQDFWAKAQSEIDKVKAVLP